MAAGEDQPEPVVVHGALLRRVPPGWLAAGVQQRGLGLAVLHGRLAAEPVDGAVPGRGDDPPGRTRRHPGLRPPPRGGRERVLYRLFRGIDVAGDADQYRDRAAVFLPEDLLDLR